MLPRTLLQLVVVTVLAGCVPSPRSPAAATPLPFFPMTLAFVGPGEAGEPVGALLGDGSIVTKRDGVIARLLPDRVVGPDGSVKILVAANGDVWIRPRSVPMRFDARGALVSPRGEVIWVDDAGTPSWTEPHGGPPPLDNVRFAPFRPEARRTAEVLLIVILEAAWSHGMT